MPLQVKFSNLLPDLVTLIINNYGFDFTLKHSLNLWKVQNDIFENLVLRPKFFWAKVSVRPFFLAKLPFIRWSPL